MHTSIAQNSVTVNRAGREQFGWVTQVTVRIHETIADQRWVELRPFADASGRGVPGTEQKLGRRQLVLHRNEVRRKNIVVILGP